jgi:hypothetical protein
MSGEIGCHCGLYLFCGIVLWPVCTVYLVGIGEGEAVSPDLFYSMRTCQDFLLLS